jgi:hypothetical protein
MSMPSPIVRQMAEQHHRDLIAQAAAQRRVRAALSERRTAVSTGQTGRGRAAAMFKAVITRSSRIRRAVPDQA